MVQRSLVEVAVLASQWQAMTPNWGRLKCVNVTKYVHRAEFEAVKIFLKKGGSLP